MFLSLSIVLSSMPATHFVLNKCTLKTVKNLPPDLTFQQNNVLAEAKRNKHLLIHERSNGIVSYS